MTDRSGKDDDQDNTETGDMNADAEGLSSAEAQQMGAGAGRGARNEPGAQASEEYVEEHVQGDSDQPANNSEISRSGR